MLQTARVYVGNLDPQVDERLLYELMIQLAPVVSLHLPKDKVTLAHQGYGFVQFSDPEDAVSAQTVFSTTKLYGKPIRVSLAGSTNVSSLATCAEVFLGNLDQLVDEALLKQTLGVFGGIENVQVTRDSNGVSRGFAFVTFENFATADKAIDAMAGQYIMNKPCTIEYAIRDGKRRGDEAERRLEKMRQQAAASGGCGVHLIN